ILARSRSATGQQRLRTRAETRGAASQECSVLSHPARRRSRGSVHEPDPYLRTGGRQSVRLPHPVAAARTRTGGRSVGLDALELHQPKLLVSGQPCFYRCHTPEMPRKQAFPEIDSPKVFGHPLRVGLYARVSTHDQQTLPLQIRSMREYAAKRNWTIAAQIKEVGS